MSDTQTNNAELNVIEGFRQALINIFQPELDPNLPESEQMKMRQTFLALRAIGLPLDDDDLRPEKLINSDNPEERKLGLRKQMEKCLLLDQNVNLSTLVNIKRGATDYNATASKISDSMWTTLTYAEAKNKDYDKEAITKANEIRSVLYDKVTAIDPFTKEETETVQPSNILQQYIKCQQNYNAALTDYAKAKEVGLNTTVENLDLWNEAIREEKSNALKDAETEWRLKGYKLTIEAHQAELAALEDRSPTVMIDNFKETFKKAKRTDPETNIDYYYSDLYPTDFLGADDDSGWTHVVFDSKHYKDSKSGGSKSGGVDAGFNGGILALFNPVVGIIGGTTDINFGFKKADGESHEKLESSDFIIEFKVCTMDIFRPHLTTQLFETTNWQLSPDAPKDYVSKGVVDGVPSDGGIFDRYTSEAIIIKDLKIKCDDLKKENSVIKKTTGGHAGVSFLIFHIGGGGSHTTYKSETKIDEENGVLEVKGKQLIGYKVTTVPPSPVMES